MAPLKSVTSEDLAALVARMPGLDKYGKLTGPSWAEAEKVYDEVLAGGRDAIAALVGMLPDQDLGDTYKARYVLHGLVVYVARTGKEKERALVVEALLPQLGGARPKAVQGIVVREIHKIAGKEATEALGKLLLDTDLGEDAAQALLAIREGAVGQFRRALPQAQGKSLLTIVQALGVLRDAESVEGLKKAAAHEDLMVRLTALWALAHIGDPGSADLVLKASGAQDTYERAKAASACLLLAERLAASGRKDAAARIYTHLRDTRTQETERYVREAAERALDALR